VEDTPKRPDARRTLGRTAVHLALIVAAVTSLVFEPVLAIHIGVGLLLTGLLAVHLGQRRVISQALIAKLVRQPSARRRSTRMALADLVLLAVTLVMLGSGLWDWMVGPTRLRWHAISGVVLAGLLLSHTVRRRRRVLTSTIR